MEGIDPANDDINISLKRTLRQEKLKSKRKSRKALQAEQKPQLLRELEPSDPQDTPPASFNIAAEELEHKLADLGQRLEAAKAVRWDEMFRDAQEARSVKNLAGRTSKNTHHGEKVDTMRRLQEVYQVRVKELKQQRSEHQQHIRELEECSAELKVYVARQRAKEQGKQSQVSEHDEKREDVRTRKEHVLRERDELAVRMARLRATQADIQVTTPSTSDAVADAPDRSATALNASDLRVDLPHGKYSLDADTTIDISADRSVLKQHLNDLRARLQVFHPRLDALPSDTSIGTEVRGHRFRNAVARDKHVLQTYLKVLIGRYRAKTGVLGYREMAAEAAERAARVGAKTLTREAKQRIASAWNERFSAKRGFVMTPEALDQMHSAQEEMLESQRTGAYRGVVVREQGNAAPQQRFEVEFEEFNEHGFLEDEYATEEERSMDEAIKDDKNNQRVVLDHSSFDKAHQPAAEDHLSAPMREPSTQSISHPPSPSPPASPTPPQTQETNGPSPGTGNEQAPWDPARKARVAAEVALLRHATTLRQDDSEVEALSNDHDDPPTIPSAEGKGAATPKPLITYESSLQPKGFVMKKQRRAVAQQTQKISRLMAQMANAPEPEHLRLERSSPVRTRDAMHTSSQTRPRRPRTVRAMMRSAYSTSARALDPLNQALKAKEDHSSKPNAVPAPQPQPHLPHLTPTGSAHMVSISAKAHTTRAAIAVGSVYFSNPTPLALITSNALKKGDVLSVSRVAGIMAAKKCPDIVPLCHPIPLTHVGVELKTFAAGEAPVSTSAAGKGVDEMGHGGVAIECKVACTGATGVEMEALTAVMGTALSVVDMCKAVDKFQRIGDVRVVLKEGGKSGTWREEGWMSWQEE
ncbi:hypothetical protein E8E12_001170 [Didymella heteroderae]|uniref:cyclic pyranopterin monophosphate synthase n=1 Tax=Didymella heteroderae TaxID=1769908 RepID=A0A9P5BW25_9PLEO|nr:hypothetical protein E8E12_001170 [Didymella heteroderae]